MIKTKNKENTNITNTNIVALIVNNRNKIIKLNNIIKAINDISQKLDKKNKEIDIQIILENIENKLNTIEKNLNTDINPDIQNILNPAQSHETQETTQVHELENLKEFIKIEQGRARNKIKEAIQQTRDQLEKARNNYYKELIKIKDNHNNKNEHHTKAQLIKKYKNKPIEETIEDINNLTQSIEASSQALSNRAPAKIKKNKINKNKTSPRPFKKKLGRKLYYAILNEEIEKIKFLIKIGADLNIDIDYYGSPLLWAIKTKHNEIARMMIRRDADLDFSPEGKSSPLNAIMFFISERNADDRKEAFKTMKSLIRHGANVNLKDSNGEIPLVKAVVHKSISVVEYLIKHGADINLKNSYGMSPLIMSASERFLYILSLLIEKGADLNITNKSNETALITAINWDKSTSASLLINSGADLDLQDDTGKTALMLAIKNKNYEITKLLIKSNANLDLQNKKGETALMLAIMQKEKIVKKNKR